MANQYVNKVELADGTTLIDLTSDTVSENVLLYGYTAHGPDGKQVTGNIGSLQANVSGTNMVSTMKSASTSNVGIESTNNTGISITFNLTTEATASAVAVASKNGYASYGMSIGSGSIKSQSTTSSKTYYLKNITVPSGKTFPATNNGTLTVTNESGSDAVINLAGDITIGETQVVDDGAWVTTNVTEAGTYYGKAVVPDPVTLVYTVGSFWATEDSTKNPATELGFGTWTKMAMDAPTVYVWKRTA